MIGGKVILTLYHSSALLALGQSLFPLFALALDLDEGFFDDKVCPRFALQNQQ